ncbi:MAG: tetratricopeptide repeat protein, partial [Thermomicrobiales bacterium]
MSNQETGTWDERVARIWADAPNTPDDELLRKIETIAAERADDDPAALYELGSVHDSVGSEHDAEPYYRRALAGNLDRRRRPQTIIQLASTLRNLGQLEESAALLTAMSDAGPDPVVGDAGTAFLALVLIDLGR